MRGRKTGNVFISSSVTMGICGVLLGLASKIFEDVKFEDASIVAYRIFYVTYGKLAVVTIIFAVIIFILGISMVKDNGAKMR